MSEEQAGYVLVHDPGSGGVYVMEKDNATVVFEGPLPWKLGDDAKLFGNARLLFSLRPKDPAFKFGGLDGRLQLLDMNYTAL